MTTRFGVLGWPIEHSRSPAMQEAGLQALGLPLGYGAFAVDPAQPEALQQAVLGARRLGLWGLNVTMPFKEQALPLCAADELARRVGAVNTLLLRGEPVRGFNTDVYGFQRLCAAAGRPLAAGLRAVLLGAGGASRAVLLALRDAGVEVTVARRGGDRGRPLRVDGVAAPLCPLEAAALRPLWAGCDLLIDATPRGLQDGALALSHPELALAELPAGCVVLDLVVRGETPLTAAARARGLRAETGAAMLLHQGVAVLALFLGREVAGLPPMVEAAMERALRASLC